MPGHVLHEAQYYVVTVSAARCNAGYSFKTSRLKTFGSQLVVVLNICCTTAGPVTAVAQSLRCFATNRKVAGSIPDGIIGIFH